MGVNRLKFNPGNTEVELMGLNSVLKDRIPPTLQFKGAARHQGGKGGC